MDLPYTTDSLGDDDPRFLTRVPGVKEIDHLFAVPASVGRGTLGVEGGVSVVAGPGMGKTSLLNRLARFLGDERGVATAIVQLPAVEPYREESGFYPYLDAVLTRIEAGLGRHTGAAGAGPGPEETTPRVFAERIGDIGAAASQASGLGLLFDDLDRIIGASWKHAFVAALRFTFQSCPGITPVYAVWMLFRDESLAGSNYFRNVTHPVFLSPLPASPGGGDRAALVRQCLPEASAGDVARVSSLGGGHPQLLHRLLADVVASGWQAGRGVPIDGRMGAQVIETQRRLVRSLLDASPGLGEALREIARKAETHPSPFRSLPKGLLASGLIDEGAGGEACIPLRVRDCIDGG
jgi:hypothetical protein